MRRRTVSRGLGPLLVLLGQACSIASDEAPPQDPYPSDVPRRSLALYQQMERPVLDDGVKRWVVSPETILEFTNGFLTFEYAAAEGISGTILSVSQDPQLVWIGTSKALQSIDKTRSFVRTYIEESSLQAVYVVATSPERAVALTSRGVVLLDGLGLAHEIYPFDDFEIRQVFDVVLFEGNVWVASRRGLKRFSTVWKSWDNSFGGKELRRTAVIRLELVPDFVGQSQVGESLYAITPQAVYIYRPTFDNWERLGL